MEINQLNKYKNHFSRVQVFRLWGIVVNNDGFL